MHRNIFFDSREGKRKNEYKKFSFIHCRNPYDVEKCFAPYNGPIEPAIALGGYPKAGAGKSVDYKMSTGLALTYLINNSKNKTALIPALEWELKLVNE